MFAHGARIFFEVRPRKKLKPNIHSILDVSFIGVGLAYRRLFHPVSDDATPEKVP